MLNCLFVGIGGFIGSVCRYLLGKLPLPAETGFPVRTLLINVIGAFLIGVIVSAAAKAGAADSRLVLLLKVGVCGGFTTFSTFSLESVSLFECGKVIQGILYIVLSVVLCLLAVMLGKYLLKIS